MKIYFLTSLYFLTALFFASCDKSTSSIDQHPIIGLWQIEQIIKNGIELDLDACTPRPTVEFTANKEVFAEYVSKDSSSVCQSSTESGDWAAIENNSVRVNALISPGEDYDFTFSISGDDVILEHQGSATAYKVTAKKIR